MTKYIVALRTGGIMEQPHIEYRNHQTIEASSPEEAEKIYNKLNNCSYFYGAVVGKDDKISKHNEPRIGNSFC